MLYRRSNDTRTPREGGKGGMEDDKWGVNSDEMMSKSSLKRGNYYTV